MIANNMPKEWKCDLYLKEGVVRCRRLEAGNDIYAFK
jgi:hypothetical protein